MVEGKLLTFISELSSSFELERIILISKTELVGFNTIQSVGRFLNLMNSENLKYSHTMRSLKFSYVVFQSLTEGKEGTIVDTVGMLTNWLLIMFSECSV